MDQYSLHYSDDNKKNTFYNSDDIQIRDTG